MTQIYIIDDYTDFGIWYSIRNNLNVLETSPRTDDGKPFSTSDKPPGNWQLRYAMHQHATREAYAKAGIRKPEFDELPCVFAVRGHDGERTIHELCKARDTGKNLDFIARILGMDAMTSKPVGSEFLYVRVEVLPADPGRVMLLNGLDEKTSGRPVADIVPHTDPGAISFKHARLTAADEDDAYLRGWDLLPTPKRGAAINDYAVRL